MTKSPAWNVIGVDTDAKRLAEEAARRADMPVGEWLASIIADKASELGVTADDADDENPLEAITASLARSRKGSRRVSTEAQANDGEADDETPAPLSRAEAARRRTDPIEASFTEARRRRPHPPLNRLLEAREVASQEADINSKVASVARRLATIENALTILLEDLEDRESSAPTKSPGRIQPNSLARSRR